MNSLTEPVLEWVGRFFSFGSLGDICLRSFVKAADFVYSKKPKSKGQLFQILVFHRVLPQNDPFAIAPVTTAYFDRQMEIIKKYFNPVSLESLITQVENGKVAPRTVCITFDDGYADNYLHAFPILKKHQVPATIFLATDFIGTGLMPWHDRILLAFKNTKVKSITFSPANIVEKKLEDVNASIQVASHLLSWLKQFSPVQRNEHCEKIIAACGVNEKSASTSGPLMMDWDQIKEMNQSPLITFGAHTLSHPILSTLPKEAQRSEILGSQELIEKMLGKRVKLFAYPNGRKGDYNTDTKVILKEANFSCAVTTNSGLCYPHGLAKFEIFRRQPWDKTPHSFFSRFLLEFYLH